MNRPSFCSVDAHRPLSVSGFPHPGASTTGQHISPDPVCWYSFCVARSEGVVGGEDCSRRHWPERFSYEPLQSTADYANFVPETALRLMAAEGSAMVKSCRSIDGTMKHVMSKSARHFFNSHRNLPEDVDPRIKEILSDSSVIVQWPVDG